MTLSVSTLKSNMPQTIYNMPEGQDALFLIERAKVAQREGAVACHVCLDDTRLANLKDLIQFFDPTIEIVSYPAWDCLPYDRVSPQPDLSGQRIEALSELYHRQTSDIKKAAVVLTTVNAFTQKTVPSDFVKSAGLVIKTGQNFSQADMQDKLVADGYWRTETVREPGEFAVRGGILDFWPSAFENPVRLDFFGDEIETIKTFDAMSQKSLESLKTLKLQAAGEVVLNDDRIMVFRKKYRDLFGAVTKDNPLYDAISSGQRIAGMEHFLPLFFEENLPTLGDALPQSLISLDEQVMQSARERWEQTVDFFDTRKALDIQLEAASKKSKEKVSATTTYSPIPPESLYVPYDDLEAEMQGASVLSGFDGDNPPELASFYAKRARDFADVRAQPDGNVLGELKKHLAQSPKVIRLVAAYSEGAKERLKAMFTNAGFESLKDCETFEQVKALKAKDLGFVILPLEHGFENDRMIVFSEQDILGDRLTRKIKKSKRKADAFIREISSLKEGDLVVHIDHGVGKFEGLETVKVDRALHDCLKLVYAGGDRLFLPVENIEVLSLFGGDAETVQLDKLGGAGWQARKARVKKDLLEMAGKLIEIAAERMLKKADTFDADPQMMTEFAARFPFHETDDQLRSIDAVKDDLLSSKPMDRLVCGDVGFGKTEVALRAACQVAMAGGQVAVVVPTTLLSRQHFENFTNRFRGFGIRIEQLSRLVTSKQAEDTKRGLKDGSVNIVIGTHALLAESVKFNHLGLVIVDEEQRFGVKQKERLKDLRKDVHVLTLTATPIPRTLQLALTGVRDMSLITTPPVDRLAVRTFVMPFDTMVVREALLREQHRGGQSFVVCPRIKDLTEMQEILKELVPELKTVAAHGQMSPSELDETMSAFYDRQFDVLLATNIIESGIDVPSANTMIVHRSDMFGLAQLYQIRGRIGRSKLRGYAYLTYNPTQKLNDIAMKRLEIIGMLDQLGSGFQLASHDMDLRGAGNLLGEQQSGHVREVGVELYQQMLEDAVADAKIMAQAAKLEGHKDVSAIAQETWTPSINLGTSVLIPESYIADLSVRMALYRRIADLEDTQDVEEFAAELIDRFGSIPEEVENLLTVITMKQLCKQAGVDSVDAGPKGVVVGFHDNLPPNPEGVFAYVSKNAGTVKLRPDQKLVFIRGWHSAEMRVKGTLKILKELTELRA